jgi:methylmalonyl-CoA/ethylmalonyl-CoA epimerase
MFHEIDHIGMAVTDLESAIASYRAQFDVADWQIVELPERHMRVAYARIGGSAIELITPTGPAAAFSRFLAERGPGMHHIAYRVHDLDATLATLRQRGVRLIDDIGRPGLHGTRVAFIHPMAVAGVLTELVEHVAP